MNKENAHPGNRRSNMDIVKNVDGANNVGHLCRTRNPPTRFAKACTH